MLTKAEKNTILLALDEYRMTISRRAAKALSPEFKPVYDKLLKDCDDARNKVNTVKEGN